MKYLLLITLFFSSLNYLSAQVGINTDNNVPDESAMLDVRSTDKGMLVPRMTTSQRTSISNPATGLLIFDTDTATFWFYTGARWENINPDLNANLSIQARLDRGETPMEIYSSDNSLLDALYGKTYQGGLIFYFNTMDGMGLVAAPTDQSNGAKWGCFPNYLDYVNNPAIGGGIDNTAEIMLHCGQTGTGAKICDELSLNAYSDWFLPNRAELLLMFEKLADSDGNGNNTGGSDPGNLGGFNDVEYLTSTQADDTNCYTIDFNSGTNNQSASKNETYYVRAARAFGATPSPLSMALNGSSLEFYHEGVFSSVDLSALDNALAAEVAQTFADVALAIAEQADSDIEAHTMADGDLSSTNEIQDLTLTNHTLNITDNPAATNIDLSPYTPDNLGNHLATQNIQLGGYWLSNDGDTEGIFVNSTGQVGVNTANISTDFEIQSDIPELRLTDGNSNASGIGNNLGKISWYSRDQSFGNDYDPLGSIELINTNGTATPDAKMIFNVWNNTSEGHFETTALTLYPTGNLGLGGNWLSSDGGSEGIAINNSGNVGIQVLTIDDILQIEQELHVRGDALMDAGNLYFKRGQSATSTYAQIKNNLDDNSTSGADQALTFSIDAGQGNPSVDVLTIRGDERVGIGTTNPGYTLHVVGQAAKTTGSSWTSISDRRLKHDIKAYREGLKEVLQINPVQFKYNALSGFDTKENHIGVIAQEMQEVLPHTVTNFEKDGTNYLAVNPSAMTYMFVNAFKELNQQHENAQAVIGQQQKKLEALKLQIETLKSQNHQQEEAFEQRLTRLELIYQQR